MENQIPLIGIREPDGYSRLVSVLKWLFPALALGLLVSIFIFSNTKKLGEGMIITDAALAELAVGQKVTYPHFSGVTKSGDAFSISAQWALPDNPAPRIIELNNPRTTISLKNGSTMRSNAGRGVLNLKTSEAELSQSVNLHTTNGYSAKTTTLLINFETGNVFSRGPVRAKGPFGSIESGTMTLTQNLNGTLVTNAVLRFNNGVKLVYKPGGS